MAFSDGVFFDPRDRLFKMWYMAGYGGVTCLAISHDGIAWDKPAFDVVSGTNIVNKEGRDSTTVWLDLFESDPRQRYKMSAWCDRTIRLYASPDGVHWTPHRRGRARGRSLDVFLQSVPSRLGVQPARHAVQFVDQRTLPPLLGVAGIRARAQLGWTRIGRVDQGRLARLLEARRPDATRALQPRLRRPTRA